MDITMFNWMNRRLYHTIRIWFRIFGILLLIASTVGGLAYGVKWVGNTYGSTAGGGATVFVIANIVTLFFGWFHSSITMIDDHRRVRKYKEMETPPLSWRLFGWMNRRAYYVLEFYTFIMASLLGFICFVVGAVLFLDFMVKAYGLGVAIASLGGIAVVICSMVIAYIHSKDAVEEELKEQDRVMKSLKKDW